MDVLENLEENVTYEVLLLTGEGVNVNIKPFGLRYTGESFVFDLFPNRTLLNIKRVGTLTVYFLYDVLAFTKAFFDELTLDELGGICHCSIRCDVKSMESYMTDDSYDYDELVGLKFKMLLNSDYYKTQKHYMCRHDRQASSCRHYCLLMS